MLQTIKWESIKQFHRLKWIIFGYAVLLLALTLIPADWGKEESSASRVVLMFFSFLLMLGTLGFSLYPMYNMISDFRRKTYTMDRTTGKSHIKVFLSKIIMNLGVFMLAAGIICAGTILMDRFSTVSMHYFTFTPNKPYPAIMLEVVLLYPAILLFCYISASTHRFFRNHRIIGTLIGIAVISSISSYFQLSGTVYYIVGFIAGMILVIASGWMADRRFEQHIYNY